MALADDVLKSASVNLSLMVKASQALREEYDMIAKSLELENSRLESREALKIFRSCF